VEVSSLVYAPTDLPLRKEFSLSFTLNYLCPRATLDLEVKKEIFVAFFLLGNSQVSELYIPTFRNTLSVPSS